MSVHGEFERLLADVRGALRDAEPEGSADWLRALEAVPSADAVGLTEAAREVLRACEAGPARGALAFEHEGEKARFEGARERLVAVCRVILGR